MLSVFQLKIYFFYVLAWIILLLGVVGCLSLSTNDFLTPADRQNLKTTLINALDSNDITAVHYAVLGLNLLKEKIPKSEVIHNQANPQYKSILMSFIISRKSASWRWVLPQSRDRTPPPSFITWSIPGKFWETAKDRCLLMLPRQAIISSESAWILIIILILGLDSCFGQWRFVNS